MRHPIEQSRVDRFLDDGPWHRGQDSEEAARQLEAGCPIFLGWAWCDLLPFVQDWQARHPAARVLRIEPDERPGWERLVVAFGPGVEAHAYLPVQVGHGKQLGDVVPVTLTVG